MSLSRKNHYIPQMYLDAWANNGLIRVYDLLVADEKMPVWSKPKQLSSIGYMKNLYIGVMSNAEFDDIEHEFNERFETPAKEPLEKIIKGLKLTSDEWHVISDFVAAQYVRVPAFYHHTHNMMIQHAKNVLNNLPPISKQAIEKRKAANIPSDTAAKEFIPLSIELTDKKTPDGDAILHIGTTVGKGYWLYSIKHFLDEKSEVRAHFHKIKWSICESAPGFTWPICDNPFVILNARSDNPGLIARDNIFVFPISQTQVLIGKNANRWPWRLRLSTDNSSVIREAIILNAERYIYNPCPDNEIPRIRPRIVNEKEFKRIKQMYDSWHDVYIEKEGPTLNANKRIKGWPEKKNEE